MSEDARKALEKMKVKELRAFAKHNEIDIRGKTKKKDIVESIASHEDIDELLGLDILPVVDFILEGEELPPPPEDEDMDEIQVFGGAPELAFDEGDIREVLSGFKVSELRKLADKFKIDLAGARRKDDILDILSSKENFELVIEEVDLLEKEKDLERIKGELIDVGVGIEETVEEAERLPVMADEEADRMLVEARNIDVDFNDVEDLLDFARMRFEEENFDKSVELSAEAIRIGKAKLGDLLRLALAYQIMSNERIVERLRQGGKVDFNEAVNILIRSKEAYKEGRFDENLELMKDLSHTINQVYSEEIKRTKDSLFETGEFIAEVGNLGAELTLARDLLQRARDASRRNDHSEAVRLMKRAREVAIEAKELRMHEIEEMIPRTKDFIEEAKHLGADVSGAEKMLMQAQIALDNDDYILCAELAGRAEARASEVQHYQIQKAMNIREKQIHEAKKRMERMVSVIAEADTYKLNVGKPKRLLYVAKETIREQDFVRMTRYITAAQDAVDEMLPKVIVERKKRGIEKPRAGICGNCKSRNLAFTDDGFGVCNSCGKTFTWVQPPDKNVWQKLRSFFWE